MDENHKDTSSKMEFLKTDKKIISNSKIEKTVFFFAKKLLNIFSFFGKFFLYLINKIKSCFSKCSILIQFPLCLVLASIIMIILIFFVHTYYYSALYVFNFSKAFKDEFFDLYITKIDDLKSELTSVVVKDTKIDIENHLFFQVYFKELASAGIMNERKEFFPTFEEKPKSISLYSKLNNIKNTSIYFDIPKDTYSVDYRYYDNLGNLMKLYYFMFPHIWYSSLITNSLINESFFIAYEVEEAWYYNPVTLDEYIIKGIRDVEIFFRYPKVVDEWPITNNFSPYDYLVNPRIVYDLDHNLSNKGDFYHRDWFFSVDYDFRQLTNNSKYDFLSNISFGHLNKENNGDINKTFISYSLQYFKYKKREFIVDIVFFWNQTDLRDENNDYSFFIVKDNFTDLLGDVNLTQKYSDNESYALSISDITEYALSDLDFKLFHLNLYDNNHNYYTNGISFDSFVLDYFYDYTKFYSAGKKVEYDLKYYVTLYLYKSLFQNVANTISQNDKDEVSLYSFNQSDKIKQICGKIDFKSYKNYLSNYEAIDCFNERTKKYFNKEKFSYTSLINDTNDIDPIYPYCSCLPLYCIKSYENLDENLDNLEFVDNINLPNKCQNKFFQKESSTSNGEHSWTDKFNDLIDISSNMIDYNYVKIKYMELNQLPGYFLFIINQIKTTGEIYIHTYYKLITKIEIMNYILVISFIASILSIIIIFINTKKYSLIISNFKHKFEFYVFHSENEDESNYSKNNNKKNLDKHIKIKENKKEEQLLNFNIENNNLLDDVFLIFSKTYNISRKDFYKYFYSSKKHKSKNQMKLYMMKEKNELFKLLSSFCFYAPSFKLNLNFDYNMYEYTPIIKKYNKHVQQLEDIDKKQIRLTKNLLIELISTDYIKDYGLITNFNFGYISNIKVDLRRYSIKYAIYENIKNGKKQKSKKLKGEKVIKNEQTKKLVLKGKNILLDIFGYNFEEDDYLNYSKLNIAFNFFLINSCYKYSRQIALENVNS